MKVQIDIDHDEAARAFTLRERAAIQILLIIFRMVLPAKYDHQVNAAFEPLDGLINRK